MSLNSAAGNTTVVDPICVARVASDGSTYIDVDSEQRLRDSDAEELGDVVAVELLIFAHRFVEIAVLKGRTLQGRSISNHIKERLDFL